MKLLKLQKKILVANYLAPIYHNTAISFFQASSSLSENSGCMTTVFKVKLSISAINDASRIFKVAIK